MPSSKSDWPNQQITITAVLADSAVMPGDGKLYLQGAGWNRITGPGFPLRHPRISLGIWFHVPHALTGRKHSVEIHLEDGDGHRIQVATDASGKPIQEIRNELSVVRPADLEPAEEVLIPMAINIDGMVFEKPGSHRFLIGCGGEVAELRFAVVQSRPR